MSVVVADELLRRASHVVEEYDDGVTEELPLSELTEDVPAKDD